MLRPSSGYRRRRPGAKEARRASPARIQKSGLARVGVEAGSFFCWANRGPNPCISPEYFPRLLSTTMLRDRAAKDGVASSILALATRNALRQHA